MLTAGPEVRKYEKEQRPQGDMSEAGRGWRRVGLFGTDGQTHHAQDADGNDVFEIYRGGEDEVLAVRINRERDRNSFYALDATGDLIASRVLEHVFPELEAHFARLHGELPGTSL